MLKVRIHKLKNGRIQTCFLDPKTGKKKRSQFSSIREAREHQRELEQRFSSMGISAFSNERVGSLMKFHMEKMPTTKVARNKKLFRAFLDGFADHRISQITKGDMHAWFLNYKVEHRLSEKTLCNFKTQINHFFLFLVNENILTINPLDGFKFRQNVPATRPRIVLSIQEVEKLIACAKLFSPNILYPFLYTMAHTGARKGEMLKLKRENVDFSTGLIHLRCTKNGLDRSVKMVPQLVELMKAHLASHTSESVFINSVGTPFGREQVERLVQRFKHEFPMEKNWTLHALRHSLAYNFLKAGGAMQQVQAILGHRHIGTTVDVYGQVAAQDVDKPSPYSF